MISSDLRDWIQRQRKINDTRFGRGLTEREMLYARVIKLGEEVGELCSEILALDKLQREEKLEDSSDEGLSGEIADVLITTLLVAEYLDIDPREVLRKKMTEIDKRFEDVKVD
jgi:NTP pyrophosphatase (non-canonical NTP hydrolase)